MPEALPLLFAEAPFAGIGEGVAVAAGGVAIGTGVGSIATGAAAAAAAATATAGSFGSSLIALSASAAVHYANGLLTKPAPARSAVS